MNSYDPFVMESRVVITEMGSSAVKYVSQRRNFGGAKIWRRNSSHPGEIGEGESSSNELRLAGREIPVPLA